MATSPPPAQGTANATDITLGKGGISVDGDLAVNMSTDLAGKPISIVPNVYYGVTDMLTVGLASNPNSEIFQNVAGAGLCLSGESNGCGKIYNNISLDALFSFMRSSTMDLGGHGGLDTSFGDSTLAGLRLGVKGKTLAGPLVLVFDPWIRFGLNKRAEGNKEILYLPVRVGFMATPQLDIGVSAGLLGFLNPPVGGFGDSYAIPVGVGGTFAINSSIAARAQFTFDNLAGKGGGADFRTLSLGAVYRM